MGSSKKLYKSVDQINFKIDKMHMQLSAYTCLRLLVSAVMFKTKDTIPVSKILFFQHLSWEKKITKTKKQSYQIC